MTGWRQGLLKLGMDYDGTITDYSHVPCLLVFHTEKLPCETWEQEPEPMVHITHTHGFFHLWSTMQMA